MPNAVTELVIVDPAEHAAVREAMIEFDPVEHLGWHDYLEIISLNADVDEDTVRSLVPIIVLEFAALRDARRAMH